MYTQKQIARARFWLAVIATMIITAIAVLGLFLALIPGRSAAGGTVYVLRDVGMETVA